MLALLGASALVLVAGAPWVPPATSGGENVKPPENVNVYIIDDNYTLTWSSKEESTGNVTFSAEYQTREDTENWIKLPGCQHVTGTECRFSLLDTNVYNETKFRVRAEKGNSTSSWNETKWFIPFYKAHIGPPGVRLEAEDKAILIYISSPGQGGNIWARDKFSFKYRIVIWQKSSGPKEIIETSHYTEKIIKLLPETTYCLQVEAKHLSLRKHSNNSAVHCINTTETSKMPAPENIEVDANSKSYVLKWNHTASNVSFRAQWLPGYSKSSPGSSSDDWRPIPACANVRTTHCVLPRETFQKGTFFLRVQASDGNHTSFWAEGKFINSQKHTFTPPAVSITPSRDALRVYVSCQGDSINCHGLHYEIIFWKNTSDTKRRMVNESPEFTIVNLQPLTVYCVQARVLLVAKRNESSESSDKLCVRTRPGNSLTMWIITGFGTVLFSLMFIYAVKSLLKFLNSLFFPSLKPPPSIDEFFSEPPSKNLLFLTAEEYTERCFIIENTDTAVVEENCAPEEDHRKYSTQTSQDSGNYSNEEESLGSESSQGLEP